MNEPGKNAITTEQFRRIREVFEATLDCPLAGRAAFIRETCSGDPTLIAGVERLLEAGAGAGALLDQLAQPGNIGICPSCRSEIPKTHRFCSSCGTPAAGSPAEAGRFRSGTLFARRFRIVGLLGRGGMGEVYRADDLELGQPVALKFLSGPRFDQRARNRLRNEVRLARQISHPNVCRVYDIGEAQGELYLSMEYVDGEDLASLLRRIGRLPVAKGIEIGRKLCAGLAVAHAKGVLHRDLKPANIMIDGSGEVRIMDFGLAVLTERLEPSELGAGTPAYMAPEQLTGRDVSVQSDLYAVGLVLYEIFTGQVPFAGRTIAEMVQSREQNRIVAPSSLAPDLEAVVERTILHCLHRDPRKRPASALAVMVSLPGGDPLAEALAAGQTPSPEMVAAAGETFGISVRAACGLVASILVVLAAVFVLGGKTNVLSKTPFERPPAALEQTARDLIRRFGYTEPIVDRVYGYNWDFDYRRYAERQEKPATYQAQLSRGQPPLIYFWYRQSPQYLEPDSGNAVVSETDPPFVTSGMVNLRLDPQGRLVQFSAVPPQIEGPRQQPYSPDWAGLFDAAGLDMNDFQSSEPQWLPPAGFDTRQAWTGAHAGVPEIPVRVEAALWRGRPVSFQVIGPWSKPDRMQPAQRAVGFGQLITNSIVARLFMPLLLAGFAASLAYRNVQRGSGDRRGAGRLAAVVMCIRMLIWLLSAHHVPTAYEFQSLIEGFRSSIFAAVALWIFYIGIEPYVRRRWPESTISWSRLLNGGFRDPLVGAHLLIAIQVGLGVGLMVLTQGLFLQKYYSIFFREEFPGLALASLYGVPSMLSLMLSTLVSRVGFALGAFLAFFVWKVLLRSKRRAAVAMVGLALGATLSRGEYLTALTLAFLMPLAIFVLLRFGVLALALAPTVCWSVLECPLTTDFSAWYAGTNIFILVVVLALTAYAFHTALSGRPLLTAKFLESNG